MADIGNQATPLALELPLAATIAPLASTYFKITSAVSGKLTVFLASPSFAAQISLVTASGQPLVQSDDSPTGASDAEIDASVPAGNDFLEVKSLSGGGRFQISASLVPASAAFQPVSSSFVGVAPIAVSDFYGNGIEDLVAPDGIHLGVGDGTFQSTEVDGPLAQNGWNVTAITIAEFNGDGRPDIAFSETSPDGMTADLCVLQNKGGGQFHCVATFSIGPQTSAIQAIDLGNGIMDLAAASATNGQIAVFTGNGHGGFSQRPSVDGGSDPSAMVSGDFGDGHVDLIVADQGDPFTGAGQGLTIFQLGQTGQLQPLRTIALGSVPSALVAADFTGDGVLDLAVAESSSDEVAVLMNNGNGTFGAPSTYAVGSLPLALVAVDLGNGRVDLATANADSDDISVLAGNGDGTFQTQQRFAVGSFPETLATSDFNGDNRPDLAVANLTSDDITVLLGRGDATFQDMVANPVGNGPVAQVTADLSHDGRLDVITANHDSNDVSVLMGNGDGTFQQALSFAAGAAPTGLVVGDFNGDGRLDLAVSDSGNSNGSGQGVSILLGDGDGTFQAPVFYAAGEYPSAIVAGDFTGNGVLDLAVTNLDSDDVSILIGNGDGGFQVLPAVPLGDLAGEPVSITAGDFTGHGVLDLAVLDQSSDSVSILEGNGQGGFQAMPPIPLGDDPLNLPMAIISGAFNGNNLLDLAVVSASFDQADNVSILLGEGQGNFDLLPSIPLGMGVFPTSITAGSFFGGSVLDLATADSETDEVSLLQGNGVGGFQLMPAIELGAGGSPAVVTAGDFTGDGTADLAIALQDPNSVSIELNQGDGQFVQPNSVGLEPRNTPLVADLTGDGVPDIAIVDGAGDILFRQGVANDPGIFAPPISINPGLPSRDITAVATHWGIAVASVDATNNAVSLFAYIDGRFQLVHTLATGLEPAQVVSADLYGMGDDDLIITNAGDGTLTIYAGNPLLGVYQPPTTLNVGMGVSDVTVADLNQDRIPDLLLANRTSGEVEVVLNLGDGHFSQPTHYRAGAGLSAVSDGTGTTPISVLSQDGTIGVAAATVSAGRPREIVAIDAGADTLGILTGLGGGRFANPNSVPTTGSTLAIRVADLTGSGIDDLAVLGPDGVTIWLGNGRGGFVQGATDNVGPDPTGLTIADVNRDKVPDLVVGNAFGDVFVLLGEGAGLFRTPTITDQRVALAVTYPGASGAPTFIISDQANDSVVVESPSHTSTVLANRTTGLLVPGEPVLADLNKDGIPDLIVLNTGGNDVLVYPGLSGGGFGPALNGGNGFPTGTNPVAVIVANLNGRPDLIVADQGSNDVSILLNEPQGNSFMFVVGPRLSVGYGPAGLLYGDFFGNGTDDLVVSDSGSNDLMVLPSLGNGFFDDTNPTIIALAESPGMIFAGSFGGNTGHDIVALDPQTSDVTLITGLSTGSPTSQIFSSGGLDPVAAIAVSGSDVFDDLVVANNADGRVALLAGGVDGLTLQQVNASLDQLNPTGLAFASLQNNSLEIYASTAGEEAATLLSFSLGALGVSPGLVAGQGVTLLPLSDQSLPLISTLLTPLVNLNATVEEPGGSPEFGALAVALATGSTGLGQGPFVRNLGVGDVEDPAEFLLEPDEAGTDATPKTGMSLWRQVEIGLEHAFEEFRRASQRESSSGDSHQEDEEDSRPNREPSAGLPRGDRRVRTDESLARVDAAINLLVTDYLDALVIPTLTRSFARATARTRLESGQWNSVALIMLPAGVWMVSARPAGQAWYCRELSARRTKKGRWNG